MVLAHDLIAATSSMQAFVMYSAALKNYAITFPRSAVI
jgi:aspartate ammonia-lyase